MAKKLKVIWRSWVEKFVHPYPTLKRRFICPLDKERVLAQDPEIIQHWFDLYQTTRVHYSIQDEDIYNMDEKKPLYGRYRENGGDCSSERRVEDTMRKLRNS